MRDSLRVLLFLAAVAVAVPLVPFVLFGTRLDHAVARWLDPPPPPPILAAIEVGVLAADLLLPVPSSVVATLGGARLGLVAGTLCGCLGMTLGSLAGWGLGRTVGRKALARLAPDDRVELREHGHRYGPLAIVLSRPLPLFAEAAAIMAGAAGMPWPRFLAAAVGGNLAVAFAWSLAGVLGRSADALQWVLAGSLAVPVAVACLVSRRSLHRRSRQV